MERMTRRGAGALALGGMAALAGCSAKDPLGARPTELGAFQLVSPIVVTDSMKKIPPSRDATGAEWEAALTDELRRRFGRQQGGRDYYIAIAVDGYSLAPPGIPIVLAPKSILVVTANLWTAAPQEKVLGPTQLSVFEGADGLVLGTGLIKDAEAQRVTLARNMARRIERWMLESPEVLGLPG